MGHKVKGPTVDRLDYWTNYSTHGSPFYTMKRVSLVRIQNLTTGDVGVVELSFLTRVITLKSVVLSEVTLL